MPQDLETAPQEAAPQGETALETPAPQTAAEGEQQPPETPEQQAEPPKPQRDPWWNRRIDELTRARREAERERDAYRAMIESQGQQSDPTKPAAPAQPTVDVETRAREIAAQERLNEAANRIYSEGKMAHPEDFDQAVMQVAQVADLSRRPDFFEAVTALPNAADVYYAMGKNPDEAAHILSLPTARMAIELARLSAEVGRPKPQSRAPAPIAPVGKTAAPSATLSEDLPMAEWIKRREETARRRR